MNIYLSENIKRLRRENELTQETLAEFLGVTFQSVSKWERGESYPDITMLPEIAGFFKVSVDELLGLNKADAERKINEYLEIYEAQVYTDTPFVFRTFQKAVKDFPSDFRLLVRYMVLIMWVKSPEDTAEYEKASKEIHSIYENIQNNCTDDNIRMWAKRLICQHLHTKAHYTGNEEYQQQAENILCDLNSRILQMQIQRKFVQRAQLCQSVIQKIVGKFYAVIGKGCAFLQGVLMKVRRGEQEHIIRSELDFPTV